MSKTKDVDVLKSIQKELKEIRAMVSGVVDEQNTMRELINMIHVKVSDLSCKVDEETSTINLVKTTNKKLKSVSKSVSTRSGKANITAYFKKKYEEAPEAFNKIIPVDELPALFEKHAAVIASKKKDNVNAFKSSLIYKEYIRPSKPNSDFVRSLKEKDELLIEDEIVN
jgi:hypothetical protein